MISSLRMKSWLSLQWTWSGWILGVGLGLCGVCVLQGSYPAGAGPALLPQQPPSLSAPPCLLGEVCRDCCVGREYGQPAWAQTFKEMKNNFSLQEVRGASQARLLLVLSVERQLRRPQEAGRKGSVPRPT